MLVAGAILEVRTDNAPALALYTGLGMQVVGRRWRYYGDSDALLLQMPPTARPL